MNEPVRQELQERSAGDLEKASHGLLRKLEAARAIELRMEEMKCEDKILILSMEEERMLRAFRSFRLRSKYGDVFKWRVKGLGAALEGGRVEVYRETGLIVDPQEG